MCCTMSLTINHIFFSGAMYPIYNDNITYRQGTVQKKVITPHAMPIIKGSLRPRNIKRDEFLQAEVASLLFADR